MAGKNTQVELIPKKGSSAIEHVESHLPASPISQVMELAQNKDFDPEKFDTIVKFMREERTWDARKAHSEAIASFQAKCPNIKKTTKGHGYKYASYEDLLDVIQPLLEEYGISIRFSFPPSTNPEMTHVIGYITVGAHTETSEFELPKHRLPQKMVPDVNDARNTGSTLSYAKRYCIINALNIVTEGEDKDGVTSQATITENDANVINALIGDIEDEPDGDKFDLIRWKEYVGVSEFTPIEEIPKSNLGKAISSLRDKLKWLRDKGGKS
jgi:hypothetical protein